MILASASPRRRELLDLIGLQYTAVAADIDESELDGETGPVLAERLARGKASVVAQRYPDALVIAADTVVVLDGCMMGKPRDDADAFQMLTALSGATHTVFTGMACWFGGRMTSTVESVSVTFRDVSADELRAYIATREPMDKAGAYGIQGYGATIVRRIDGDYFSVMGLSLVRLVELLRDLGLEYRFDGTIVPR